MTKWATTALSLLGIMFALQYCTQKPENVVQNDLSTAYSTGQTVQMPFPDFGFMIPPKDIKDPSNVFKLSQNYPTTLPVGEQPPFLKTDFQKDWYQYLMQVRDYCLEGNTDVDFRVENNKKRNWYHMPWQHYGPNGREGFHGLTKEAPVAVKQLAPTQTSDSSGAWAIGFFNDVAGYSIGQVWKTHDNPNVTAMAGGFKNGAVLFKILFLSMPQTEVPKQVPFLDNGIWWDAFATYNFNHGVRQPIKVVLIQMDIMVRDERAPNGWVFGNFQYNGAMNKANKWENLVPLGIMWGQDPDNNTDASNPTPTATVINPNLKQTIINPNTQELPPTHLGWNSRLNGPVDNPKSSCYSCHATAEFPQGSPMSPMFDKDTSAAYPPGSAGWMRWFQNTKCGTPFDPGDHHSTDFCIQMAEALQNFDQWRAKQDGLFAKDYPAVPQQEMAQSKQAQSAKQKAVQQKALVQPTVVQSAKYPDKKVFSLGQRNQ